MVILFDVDGVLADFQTAFLETARRVLGRSVSIVRSDVWDLTEQLALNEDEAERVWATMNLPGVARCLEPLPGAIEAVRQISEEITPRIYFVTSPVETSPTWQYDRAEWLVDHFGKLGRNVISTTHKELVRGDLFVDDKPKHVAAWGGAHPEGQAYIWDQPYNRDEPWPRLTDWRALTVVLCEFRAYYSVVDRVR